MERIDKLVFRVQSHTFELVSDDLNSRFKQLFTNHPSKLCPEKMSNVEGKKKGQRYNKIIQFQDSENSEQ